jgi:hypothetical protein
MSRNCKVCLVEHDDEVHAATNRVHAWFRAQVTQSSHDAAEYPMLSQGEELGVPQLNAA